MSTAAANSRCVTLTECEARHAAARRSFGLTTWALGILAGLLVATIGVGWLAMTEARVLRAELQAVLTRLDRLENKLDVVLGQRAGESTLEKGHQMARRRGRAVASTYVSTTGGLTLSGAEGVISVLENLPRGMQTSVLGPALTAAGKPLAKAAKANLQRGGGGWDTGDYRRSIGAKLQKKKSKTTRLLRVGARSEKLPEGKYPSNIDSLLEYGHGGPHPAEPVPHLRPALDSKKDEAIAAFNRRAWTGIEKQVVKLRTKAAAKPDKYGTALANVERAIARAA